MPEIALDDLKHRLSLFPKKNLIYLPTPLARLENLTREDLRRNDLTIKNVRLWNDAPLLQTYGQLQEIRTYYKFTDVDNDRYTVNDNYLQVMLSPRELSYADLPEKSWINERLVFTHGFGLTYSHSSSELCNQSVRRARDYRPQCGLLG